MVCMSLSPSPVQEAGIRQGAGGFWDEFSLDTLVEAGLAEHLDKVQPVIMKQPCPSSILLCLRSTSLALAFGTLPFACRLQALELLQQSGTG